MVVLLNKMSVHLSLPSVIHSENADVPFVSSLKSLASNLSMSQHVRNTCKTPYRQIRHINTAPSQLKKSISNSSVLSCDYTAALCFLDAFCTCDRNFRKSFFLLPQISPPLRGGAMVTPLRRWSTKYRFVFYFMETGGGGLFF